MSDLCQLAHFFGEEPILFPMFFGSPQCSGELNQWFRASKFLLDLPTKHLFLNSKTNVRNPAKSVFCGAQAERKKSKETFQI